jgi:hypothetical protein
MDLHLLIDNLTNPALLFFFLGLIAVQLKSDLAIPVSSGRFISFYLLLSIGFRGGQELAHSPITAEIIWSLLFGVFLAVIIPFYTFYILRKKFTIPNSGAIAAAYGSVSAVTFVTTISFLEMEQITFGGHMVAVMALMEAPAIIVGLLLISLYDKKNERQNRPSMGSVVKHSFTNASVLLILGSVIIGILASDAQAESIKPFTTDLFKGFLMIFLLDMGITSGKELTVFVKKSGFAVIFAIVIPIINGVAVAIISGLFIEEVGNRLLFAILAASASYIAVPAAMKLAAPDANPSLYIPMSLAVTFPFNITLGLPLYLYMVQSTFL